MLARNGEYSLRCSHRPTCASYARRLGVKTDDFRYSHNLFVRKEWFGALEAFLATPPVTAVTTADQIKRVEWSPGTGALTVLCNIEPNPCPHKHRHRPTSWTKLVVPSRGMAYWTCCGMGVYKFGVFDASQLRAFLDHN